MILAMEIVGAVASIFQLLCGQCCSNGSISEQCRYLRKPQSVLLILEEKLKLLTAREADVIKRLHLEKVLSGMDPTAEVNLWLENVQKMKTIMASLGKEIQDNKSCLCGCFPNYYLRLKLGNSITKKMHEVHKLLDDNKFSASSLVNMVLERGKALPVTTLVGETAKRILLRTWEFLMDENIGIIGIYGMGGVGKTSIVKEINNQLLSKIALFDNVIWVTASKDSNLQKLQKGIANEIGLSFGDEDGEHKRASKLYEAFLRRGRFLLMIDDLWKAFSLEEIGIPNPTNLNGCKLLITTRSSNVCRCMETVKEIEVRVLSMEEGWDLFKQKVGEEVFMSPRIQDLAKDVVKECAGLPLALITVGRALRKENSIRQWQTALSELKNSTANIEGVDNQVFARLRFSYDRLKDDMTRSCFLYCALYPEDHIIEVGELIKYWLWEGLLGSVGSQMVKMRLGKIIVYELKSACMIEGVYQDGNTNEYVKMHDVVRDMVIALTRANSSFMIKAGLGLQLPPVENEWPPELERVSLMRNDLSCLSREPKCPKLCTLLLQYNSINKEIHHSFFHHMQNLKVLDLSFTGVDSLPISLSNLVSLRALLLCSCWNLSHVPTVAKLKELRVLDLSYTSIEHLPEGMDMLVNLQYLDLSYTGAYEIPVLRFREYKFLESLFINGLLFSQEPNFVDALVNCSSLAVLEANFSTMQEFEKYIASGHWNMLENFRFVIGHPTYSTRMGTDSVRFFGVHISEGLSPDCLPRRILELEIQDCTGITHLPVCITAAASQLQHCRINYCDEMEWIITAEWSTFPNLEWLEIEGLSKLSGLCRGITPVGTLASLRVLNVTACNDLKTLLPLELVQHLRNLEEITVQNCDKMMEIIAPGEDNQGVTEVNNVKIDFPRLQKLKLSSLPELRHIFNGIMTCDSLSSIEVYRCKELKVLPFFVEIRQQLLHSLKQIKGSRWWWQALAENHKDSLDLLFPIFKEELEIYSLGEGNAENPTLEEEDTHSRHSVSSIDSSYGPR
ncbi:disease resistance protein RPS2-like isoform X1 [Olea europaea var. sylvestris]|uniref:disease resistance protein RPS2-like isoform X1 n=2 Tax=Olea europaea var. sylvestris TaxID=158386 RepID=UPI000C1D77EF|nr:disease resistance protein RPS2-like isoform X1 [Olea europaea var. sylvestris]